MNFKTHLGLPQSYISKWQLHVRVCVTHDKKNSFHVSYLKMIISVAGMKRQVKKKES